MGPHFASINNNELDSNRPQLGKLINKEINIFKNQIEIEKANNITICTFNNKNKTDDPNPEKEYKNYFTYTYSVNKKFRHLNNKKSFELDKIPNIALKNIPMNLVYNYTIIFIIIY